MPQQVLALALDGGELRAVVVETSFRDYRVVGLHRLMLQTGNGSTAEQLREFLREKGIEATTVLSALPSDQVTWRTLSLPFRDRKRLDQTVPFELESHVPFGLDDVVIDYHVLRRDRSGSTVLAALVRRRDLEAHLALMTEAGLDPKLVDIAPLAALNIVHLLGDKAPASFVFLGGDSNRVVVAAYREGALAGLRLLVPSASETAGPEPSATEPSATEPSPTEPSPTEPSATHGGNGHAGATPDMLRDLAAEVRWSILALCGGEPDAGTPCLVATDDTGLHAVAAEVCQGLEMAPQAVDGSALTHIAPALREEIAGFASPLGLALREVAPNQAVGVNFRQGEFAYHRAAEEVRRALWRTAALAAVVVALFTANTYVRYNELNSRLSLVQTQIREVFTQTLPNVVSVVEPRMQLQAEIDAEQRKLELLGGMAPLGGATAIDSMRALASAIPQTVKLDVDQYLMDPESIRIKASTDSFESADTIKQRIEDTGYFGGVQVKDVKTAPDGRGVDFRLTVFFNRDGAGAPPLIR